MNIVLKRILGSSLLGLLGTVGVMQAGQQAKFHLPVTAKWGGVVLVPGDYSMSLPETSLSHRQFLVTGEGTTAFIPVMMTDFLTADGTRDKHSGLKLVDVDGTYYVESYKSESSSKEFFFKLPSPKHHVHVGKREVTRVDVAGE